MVAVLDPTALTGFHPGFIVWSDADDRPYILTTGGAIPMFDDRVATSIDAADMVTVSRSWFSLDAGELVLNAPDVRVSADLEHRVAAIFHGETAQAILVGGSGFNTVANYIVGGEEGVVTITPSVLVLDSAAVNPPTYDYTFNGIVGDTIELKWWYSSAPGTVTTESIVFDDEAISGVVNFPIWDAGLTGGETVNWYWVTVRGGTRSANSNTLSAAVVSALTPNEFTNTNGTNKSQFLTVSGTPPLVITGQAGFNNAPISARSLQARTGKRQWQMTMGTYAASKVYMGADDGSDNLNSGFSVPGMSASDGVVLRADLFGWEIYAGATLLQSGNLSGGSTATGDIWTMEFDEAANTASFFYTRSAVTTQIGTTVTGLTQTSWSAFVGTEGEWVLTTKFDSGQTRALTSGYSYYDG